MENYDIIKSIETFLINGYLPENRAFFVVENVNHDLFVHGGSNKVKECTQIDIFDAKTMQWSVITDVSSVNPFFIFDKPLSGHSSNLVNRDIFIYGGFDGNSYSNSIYKIDTDDYSFTQIDVRGGGEYPQARNYHTANYCYLDRVIYIFGGWNGNISNTTQNNFTSLWKFDLRRISI